MNFIENYLVEEGTWQHPLKIEETAVQSGENGTTLELPDCCNFRADRVPEKFRLRSGLVENVQQFRLEENEECPLCYLRRMTFNDRFKRFVWLLIWIWRGQQFVRLWLVRPWPIRNQFRTSCFALKRTLWSLQWNFVEKARRSDVPHNQILFLLRFTTDPPKDFLQKIRQFPPSIRFSVPQRDRIADCVPAAAIYDFTGGERAGIHAISP